MKNILSAKMTPVICNLIIFSLIIFPFSTFGDTFSFKNFSETITLESLPSQVNQYSNNGIVYKTDNRFIIKTISGFTKKDIQSLYPTITEVKELFRLEKSVYFGISIGGEFKYDEITKNLSLLKGVLLVQPDLLQLRTKKNKQLLNSKITDYVTLLGIDKLWQRSKGKSVKIAIIDDGVDLSHEDLKNTRVAFSYDLQNRQLDSSPKFEIDRHGTQVAGIIFAEHNGIGIDGIAPEADLISIRDTENRLSNFLISFNIAKLAGADIINCSWISRILLEPEVDVINDLATNGRNGKGIAVVFSAGNDGKQLELNGNEAVLPSTLGVGSLTEQNQLAKFSNHGPLIEFYTYGTGILSTYPDSSIKYKVFSGTSASAPIVSGIIALLLSENYPLTLEQLKKQLHSILDEPIAYGTTKN